MDLSQPVVLGHEYCAEIVDYGPRTERRLRVGTRVTSAPVVIRDGRVGAIGLSNDLPGGFGEYMRLSEDLLLEVPDALDDASAALIEPVSVGMYYVRAARLRHDDVVLIVGCGAIGLAVLAALRREKVRRILVSDFSAERRMLALANGAHAAIDPAAQGPMADGPPSVIFECVGTPGVLDEVMRQAGQGARIMVAGWCLETDHIFTPVAHTKGLIVQFGGGPAPEDFEAAHRALGEGEVDVSSWLGAQIGLSDVADALEAMRDPANPIRTVVDPRRG
jgi:threonine dehydrogenase-like Zn-dependent dehydrogenase